MTQDVFGPRRASTSELQFPNIAKRPRDTAIPSTIGTCIREPDSLVCIHLSHRRHAFNPLLRQAAGQLGSLSISASDYYLRTLILPPPPGPPAPQPHALFRRPSLGRPSPTRAAAQWYPKSPKPRCTSGTHHSPPQN